MSQATFNSMTPTQDFQITCGSSRRWTAKGAFEGYKIEVSGFEDAKGAEEAWLLAAESLRRGKEPHSR